jgi:organic hydroperoxide reductase OsmC/OhrA
VAPLAITGAGRSVRAMSEHSATIRWSRAPSTSPAAFTGKRYSRVHEWRFDGGAVVAAAASPHIVPPEHTDAAGVDPEEAFVASLSSCHLLWFLAVASKHGHVVESYDDDASGTLAKNADGRLAITRVVLRPKVTFASAIDGATVRALHEQAHGECFLASSVRSEVVVEPRF